MKISEILRFAADERLAGTRSDPYPQSWYSCNAVLFTAPVEAPFKDADRAVEFMHSLGCSIGSGFFEHEFGSPEAVQGARFLWLHFAALVAEDEGD